MHKVIAEWIPKLRFDSLSITNKRRIVFCRKNIFKYCPLLLDLTYAIWVHCINYQFMCLSASWQWKGANEHPKISAVIVKIIIGLTHSKARRPTSSIEDIFMAFTTRLMSSVICFILLKLAIVEIATTAGKIKQN